MQFAQIEQVQDKEDYNILYWKKTLKLLVVSLKLTVSS